MCVVRTLTTIRKTKPKKSSRRGGVRWGGEGRGEEKPKAPKTRELVVWPGVNYDAQVVSRETDPGLIPVRLIDLSHQKSWFIDTNDFNPHN